MKVPYDQLPDSFKKSFEATGHGDEILYAIYKRKGYDETTYWEWYNLERDQDDTIIEIELADAWNNLSEGNQRTLLKSWMEQIKTNFDTCQVFMRKYL
jgi:hypothetical protein